jgi:HK97 family phage portal protein
VAPSWLSGVSDTFAGVNVTPDNALGVAAVFAAVRVGSESTAVLSLDLFRRLDNGGKEKERGHAASWLMREQPNPDTSPFVFRETLQGYTETWGNAFAEIAFDGGGQPRSLDQRPSNQVPRSFRRSRRLFYEVTTEDGKTRDVPAEKMLHIPAFSGSGLWGLSPVETLRETVGRNMAHGRYRSGYFGNGLSFSGLVEHPGSVPKEGKEEIIAALEKMHKGPGNAFRAAVMDEGMTWKQISLPNDAAQMIETGLYELSDVARAWRIPPHLLMELSHATFTNIEHQGIEFVQHSLLPRCQRWVGELNRKLLTETERRAGLFFEFNLDTLLRGDFETRSAGLASAIGTGQMTPNEARALENMNPVNGGDTTYVPLNWRATDEPSPTPSSITERTLADGTKEVRTEFAMGETRLEQLGDAKIRAMFFEGRATVRDLEPISQRSAESRWRLRDIFEGLLLTASQRIVNREVGKIREHLSIIPTGGVAGFRLWLEKFLERHAEFARDVAGPVLLGMFEAMSAEALEEVGGDVEDFRADLEVFHAEYAEAFGQRTASIANAEIDKTIREALDVEAEVGAMLDGWTETKAAKMALATATDGMGAVSLAAYAFAGVTTLRWIWQGGDCKICPNLHGKVVAIGERFVDKGDRVGDPEQVSPMTVRQVRKYPGLHGGCKCTVGPG